MQLWLYLLGRSIIICGPQMMIVDQLQSCRPEILYPQLVHDTPKKQILKKYTTLEKYTTLVRK